MHRSRRLAIPILALALAVPSGAVLAQSPSLPAASEAPTATPVAPVDALDPILADAIAATMDAGTVRMTISVVFTGSSLIPEGTSILGEGQTSLGLGRSQRLSLDMTSLGSGTVEVIVEGDQLYVRGDFLGSAIPAGKWLAVDLTAEDAISVQMRSLASGNNDASLLLYYLMGATRPAELVGEETLDGAATTRYRTTIDLDRALSQVPADIRPTLSDNLADIRTSGAEPIIETDAWIDDASLVHRLAFRYVLGAASGNGHMDVTFSFSQHGQPLDLGIPAAEDTVDVSVLTAG